VEEPTDVTRMIVNAELLLNHADHQGAGPDAGEKAIGDRAAVDNVGQEMPVEWAQGRWPPRVRSLL
jgi:hypothetical protein